MKEEILAEWNPWWSGHYEVRAVEREMRFGMEPWTGRKEIVALIGVRRSGKTTIIKLLIAGLISSGRADAKNILFIKCDDERVPKDGIIDDAITTYRHAVNPGGKVFIFIDEVQEAPGWGGTLKRIYDLEPETKIFIAGSSSAVLREEISTTLAGRAAYFPVAPFSFREFLRAKNIEHGKMPATKEKDGILHVMREYLEFGGFPEVVLEKDKKTKSELLKFYFDSIMFRDIVRRYSIRNVAAFEQLTMRLLANVGNPVNFSREAAQVGLSVDSVSEYARFFQETFFIFFVPVFSYSVKAQQINPKKVYCIDSGIRNFAGFRFSEDAGRLLENAVFIELMSGGDEIFYWKNGGEVDFITKRGNSVNEVIQVCWDMKTAGDRETDGILEAMEELGVKKGTIITWDFEDEKDFKGKTVYFRPAWKWLLFDRKGATGRGAQ